MKKIHKRSAILMLSTLLFSGCCSVQITDTLADKSDTDSATTEHREVNASLALENPF
jgi:PBP1b-binding outer membrane lipoprotein LpoB